MRLARRAIASTITIGMILGAGESLAHSYQIVPDGSFGPATEGGYQIFPDGSFGPATENGYQIFPTTWLLQILDLPL